jgi:hypothetical protein
MMRAQKRPFLMCSHSASTAPRKAARNAGLDIASVGWLMCGSSRYQMPERNAFVRVFPNSAMVDYPHLDH